MQIYSTRIIKISELIFLVSFFCYIFLSAIGTTQLSFSRINLLRNLSLVLLPIKLLMDKTMSRNNFIKCAALCFLGVVVGINSGRDSHIMAIILFIIAANNVSSEKIIRVAFFAIVLVMVITLCSVFLGIIPSVVSISTSRPRYNLGFIYYTFSANYFFHAVLMWIFLKKGKLRIYEYIVITVFNYILYKYTDTRAVYFEMILLLLCCAIIPHLSDLNRGVLRIFFKSAFLWSAAIALVLQIFYSNSITWMVYLDKLLSNRLRLGNLGYNKYGISLFGNPVEWNQTFTGKTEYFYVDSSYLQIAMVYGIIVLALLLIGLTILMMYYVERNEKYCCLALLFLAIHSITDPQLFGLYYNPFLCLLGWILFQNRLNWVPTHMEQKWRLRIGKISYKRRHRGVIGIGRKTK